MCEEFWGVDDESGQSLFQVGHSCQQAFRIRKTPVPSCVLWKNQGQTTCFLSTDSPGPQDGTGRPGWLGWACVGQDHPVLTRLLQPGTRGSPRERGAWHDPD